MTPGLRFHPTEAFPLGHNNARSGIQSLFHRLVAIKQGKWWHQLEFLQNNYFPRGMRAMQRRTKIVATLGP
ncbi:hypothetical protein, partial [Azotobacter vinelandii]|uniref:hypothetical protein n=1 Tax=Azotobacter vinelandii TaxID=354 RepID=UPI001E308CC7